MTVGIVVEVVQFVLRTFRTDSLRLYNVALHTGDNHHVGNIYKCKVAF